MTVIPSWTHQNCFAYPEVEIFTPDAQYVIDGELARRGISTRTNTNEEPLTDEDRQTGWSDINPGEMSGRLPGKNPPFISWGRIYDIGLYATAAITFIGCWIYAVVSYGWFLGLGLGWFPAAVIGIIAGLLWPLIALAVLGFLLYFSQ